MVQRILPKVMLPLFTKSSKYCLVRSIWKQYLCEDDDYEEILLNEKWRVEPSIFLNDDGVQFLMCKFQNGGQ